MGLQFESSTHPQTDRKLKIMSKIRVIAILVLTALLAVGYLFYINKTGQDKQDALQFQFNSLEETTTECLMETGRSETELSDDDLGAVSPILFQLSLVEFVDEGGRVVSDPDPEIVYGELLRDVSETSALDFSEGELSDLVDLFLSCRTPASPIFEEATSFQDWTNGGTFLTGWIRSQYPNRELEVPRMGNYDHPTSGQEALDRLSQVVWPPGYGPDTDD